MPTEREAYDEICAYTLTHGGVEFIHQHVVDAWAAQHATPGGTPISITFALAGLYLHVEKQRSGREVQRAHMLMAKKKRTWPAFVLPLDRGALTALDVFAASPGPARDSAIHAWAESVWRAFAGNRRTVIAILDEFGLG